MSNFYGISENKIREYARLVVRTGVNAQPGQEIVISCPVEHYEFARLLIEEAYSAGAGEVIMKWSDSVETRQYYENASEEVLSTVPEWKAESYNYYSRRGAGYISVSGSDPESLKGVDPKKMHIRSAAMDKALEEHYKLMMSSEIPWTVAAVPQKQWAKKVFPGLPKGKAVEKLWEAILSASRVTDDPVKAWDEHNADLKKRCDYLNSLSIRSLHYTADNGTDLTVGMIPEAVFCGGGEVSRQGIFFNPNIPTEECFISPMRGQAEGIVYSTMPLSYNGQLIENFSLRFENGKAVEAKAEKGEELLNTMITMDEGAAYLGECALVPQHSPIAESGLLFYETLFDENASCHLAMGAGYADTIRDHHSKTLQECQDLGINDSMIHVDFMIGCDSMNIDAICEDGKVVPIFRNGNWAF